jgi:hypothetical protein
MHGVCYRDIEAAGFRNLLRMVRPQLSTRKSERVGPTENSPPTCTLYDPGPETEWNPDWLSAGLQTTARQDFPRSWVV